MLLRYRRHINKTKLIWLCDFLRTRRVYIYPIFQIHTDIITRKQNENIRQKELMAKSLPKRRKIEGVENVIMVSSAKGGVGKSTTAVNLALALSSINKSNHVGLLDMDVFGPSIPRMMNISDHPDIDTRDNLIPLSNYGVKCMSMGLLVDKEAAIVWRGPMVMSAVQRLLLRTNWGKLKYLVLDLPPGTGDTQLSISQLVHVNGAIIVSTPQDIALLDVRRGIEMFKKVNIPVLGLVQNMSVYICANCGHEEHIFGKDGVKKMSEEKGIDVLGDVPLNLAIRQGSDSGQPFVAQYPEDPKSEVYLNIARAVARKLDENQLKNEP